MRRLIAVIALLVLFLVPAGAEARKSKKRHAPVLQSVLVVGNNWDGTADVIHPTKFKRLTRLNIIPDKDERWPRSSRTPTGWATSLRSASSWARATTSSWTTRSPRTTAAS